MVKRSYLKNISSLSVALRNEDEVVPKDKFGRNTSVGTTLEDIWDVSANISFLTSAETILVQSSGNDNGASSTGARTVTIEGLDNDWNEISETITTNASVDPETTQSFL